MRSYKHGLTCKSWWSLFHENSPCCRPWAAAVGRSYDSGPPPAASSSAASGSSSPVPIAGGGQIGKSKQYLNCWRLMILQLRYALPPSYLQICLIHIISVTVCSSPFFIRTLVSENESIILFYSDNCIQSNIMTSISQKMEDCCFKICHWTTQVHKFLFKNSRYIRFYNTAVTYVTSSLIRFWISCHSGLVCRLACLFKKNVQHLNE